MSSQAVTSEQTVKPKGRFVWRRLIRFRLLTLLVLITAIALAFGWWSHGARKQREAVAVFEKIGGSVMYDFEIDNPEGPKYWPPWLVEWLGVDYFSNVTLLILSKTQVTDDGLKHLEGLTALEQLSLSDIQITDEGLKYLKRLEALAWLILDGTQITDEGLKHLEGLEALEPISLARTQVTDEGLKHLERHTALTDLNIHSTHISDEGLKTLSSLVALEELVLDNTRITDDGLKHLEGITTLKRLWLIDTQVSRQGAARLRKKLPNCNIIR